MNRRVSLRRRQFLGVGLAGVGAALAGCPKTSQRRKIDFSIVDVRETADNWRVQATVRTLDETGEGFSNVSVVGAGSSGEVLCQQHIGAMSTDGQMEEREVSFRCPERPSVLIPDSDASPCDDSTTIETREYDARSEIWETVVMDCQN